MSKEAAGVFCERNVQPLAIRGGLFMGERQAAKHVRQSFSRFTLADSSRARDQVDQRRHRTDANMLRCPELDRGHRQRQLSPVGKEALDGGQLAQLFKPFRTVIVGNAQSPGQVRFQDGVDSKTTVGATLFRRGAQSIFFARVPPELSEGCRC